MGCNRRGRQGINYGRVGRDVTKPSAFIIGIGMALLLCAGAEAQTRGRHSAPVRVPVTSGARIVRMAPPQAALTQFSRGIRVLPASGFTTFGAFPDGSFPVPGLGFDFVHFAAVHPHFQATHSHRQITPIIPIGFPFFSEPAAPQIIVMPQPPVVVLQQPGVMENAGESTGHVRAADATEIMVPARAVEPSRDVGEFVLVRRDGRLVFAVAFSAEGGQLIYITREGVRRSLPLAELDIEATRRMNEERGTTLHLPV